MMTVMRAQTIVEPHRGLWPARTSAQAKACASVVLLGVGFGLWGMGGCREDVRLAGQNVRSVTVDTATHYGVTLDEAASPEQVAYVLLRAIREDFHATGKAERESALDKQFDVCAAGEIQKRNSTVYSRDTFVHNTVWRWTPTVSHYASDFDTDWDKAKARLIRKELDPKEDLGADLRECKLHLAVADPNGDPNAGAVVEIHLVKDSGYWRVLRIGFVRATRSIEVLQAPGGE